MNPHLERAAALIATLDPHLAGLWRKCPHRRRAIVAVLRQALLDHPCPRQHDRADNIAFALYLAIETSELEQIEP